jgi:hydroxypyruvate reductase
VKEVAKQIFHDTLAALDVAAALDRKLDRRGNTICFEGLTDEAQPTRLDLRGYREILAIAFGKAAFPMAQALQQSLAPDFAPEGILVTPDKPPEALPNWTSYIGGHPVPTEGSFAAARAILDRLHRATKDTLIFFLLSGGGSALVELPLNPEVSLPDFQGLHKALVTCGAPIEEINAIRKHLSATKGGRLAFAAPQSTKITLAISDVPPGNESALASGPTLPDPTTLSNVNRIVAHYQLLPTLPQSLRKLFERQALKESPKPGDPGFDHSSFTLILSGSDLVHHAHLASEAHGLQCIVDRSVDGWPLDRAADHLLSLLDRLQRKCAGAAVAVIVTGEMSSPVTGKGIGGRNSAFALACAERISGKKIAVLSAGTDGIDGNSPGAGAVADGETLDHAKKLGLDAHDYFARSDAFTFFEKLGDAIVTGPTGNNLRDLQILIAW